MGKKFWASLLALSVFAMPLFAGCAENPAGEIAEETESKNSNENPTETSGGNMETMENTESTAQTMPIPEIFEPPGVELLKNPDFSEGLKNWRQYAKCNPELVAGAQGGQNSVLVTEMSANWAVVCQDLTKPLNDCGKGTYYFGASVKTGGGAAKIMVVVHYRDDTGRNWVTSDYVGIDDKSFTYIDKTAIIDWSGDKTTEVDIYLSLEKPFEGGIIIDSMTFRHVSEMTEVEGLYRPDVALRNESPLVGVIRWDAWIGDGEGGVGQVVNRSLSPEKYHFRMPWFSKIVGPNEVFIDGATQELADKETQFAKTYGIDYFAILHYDDGMSFARKAYLNSLYRNGIKWCVVFGCGTIANDYDARSYYVKEFKKPYYQKTADGRPVIYIFQVEPWIKEGLDVIRSECEREGIPEPYVIGMNFDIPKAAMIAAELGLQGVSLYTGGSPSPGCPYSAVMESDEAKWRGMKKTGAQFVPQITTGWDKRPRYDNPNPWEPDYEDFKNQYSEQATPEQIAQSIENAFKFNDENKERTVFNSVIVYAWNENDEGGWIVPTYFELRDSGKPLRLDAIREMLKSRRAAYSDIAGLEAKTREAIENLAVAGVFGNIEGELFEPQKEVGAAEFAAYFVRSVGYWAEIGNYGLGAYDEAIAIAGALGLDIEAGDPSITYSKAVRIAADMAKAAGETKQLAEFSEDGSNAAGGEKLTRASAALLVHQLTQAIFDLPKTVPPA